MKKILKWTGIVLGSLILILLVTGFLLVKNMEKRMAKVYEVTPAPVSIPTDSAAIAEGYRLSKVHCIGCHGGDLSGKEMFNDPSIAVIFGSNLTPGKGGVGAAYSDAEWVRAIRHGIKNTGLPAMIMPSKEFQYLSDQELGYMISYLKTLPAVDKEVPPVYVTGTAKLLAALGMFGVLYSAEVIDHAALTNVPEPNRANPLELGAYLTKVGGCSFCHGPDLAGGKLEGDPEAPPSPNISSTGPLGQWSSQEFISFMRSGVTPEKRTINPKFMPWDTYGNMTDAELTALHQYLLSQAAPVK